MCSSDLFPSHDRDGKWTVVRCDDYTPETVWDSNSPAYELKAMGIGTVSLLKDRVRELNTEMAITVAKYIKSFSKLNPIMAYILDDDYNYISVPSKGINETVQFLRINWNWCLNIRFRFPFCSVFYSVTSLENWIHNWFKHSQCIVTGKQIGRAHV